MAETDTVPKAAWQLGLAGLLPFGALALGVFLGIEGAQSGLLNYGALILSFMGGCRWGFAAAGLGQGATFGLLGVSVLPALYAWCALLLPFGPAALALSVGFLALYVADRALTHVGRGCPRLVDDPAYAIVCRRLPRSGGARRPGLR